MISATVPYCLMMLELSLSLAYFVLICIYFLPSNHSFYICKCYHVNRKCRQHKPLAYCQILDKLYIILLYCVNEVIKIKFKPKERNSNHIPLLLSYYAKMMFILSELCDVDNAFRQTFRYDERKKYIPGKVIARMFTLSGMLYSYNSNLIASESFFQQVHVHVRHTETPTSLTRVSAPVVSEAKVLDIHQTAGLDESGLHTCKA